MDPIVSPEDSILDELGEMRPPHAPTLLSRTERNLLVERGFVGLYRWYLARSQATRNWNPDQSFDWRNFSQTHSDDVHTILEGFYAVEQYVPDYTAHILNAVRTSYGRSQFQLRWGSEEEKHADLWRNAVTFGGKRSLEWIEDYSDTLRGQEWTLPWDDPLHMLFYTVFQERATQVNYVNLGLIAKGENDRERLAGDVDPVLAQVCRTIAIDEAAHYNFFLEGARLMLYYFPEESIDAMIDVLRHFSMPAGHIIPDYSYFSEVVYKTGVYGPRDYSRDVVKIALGQLGAESLKSVEEGIRRSREVPRENGSLSTSSIFETLDFDFVERKVQTLFGKINNYEREVGFDAIRLTQFVANPDLRA